MLPSFRVLTQEHIPTHSLSVVHCALCRFFPGRCPLHWLMRPCTVLEDVLRFRPRHEREDLRKGGKKNKFPFALFTVCSVTAGSKGTVLLHCDPRSGTLHKTCGIIFIDVCVCLILAWWRHNVSMQLKPHSFSFAEQRTQSWWTGWLAGQLVI